MSKYINFVLELFEINEIHYSWYLFFIKNKKELYDIFTFINNDIYYPSKENIFKVFQMPLDKIKLLILSQDPYIKKNQATGLAFSVHQNEKIPPSLTNIFKEINIEYNNKYNIVYGIHPSPQSSHLGFFSSNIFIKIDNLLYPHVINWQN